MASGIKKLSGKQGPLIAAKKKKDKMATLATGPIERHSVKAKEAGTTSTTSLKGKSLFATVKPKKKI